MRNGSQMEDRVVFSERIVAGMVAERPLWAQLARDHIPFQHDLGMRGHFKVDGLALDHLHGFAPDDARNCNLVPCREGAAWSLSI